MRSVRSYLCCWPGSERASIYVRCASGQIACYAAQVNAMRTAGLNRLAAGIRSSERLASRGCFAAAPSQSPWEARTLGHAPSLPREAQLPGPVAEVEHLALASHLCDSAEIDVGIDPLRGIQRAAGKYAVVGKPAIDGRVDGRGADIDVDCGRPRRAGLDPYDHRQALRVRRRP